MPHYWAQTSLRMIGLGHTYNYNGDPVGIGNFTHTIGLKETHSVFTGDPKYGNKPKNLNHYAYAR